MSIFENPELPPLDETDPDDYRPNSRMAVFADPVTDTREYVRDLCVLVEGMAPGDHIPLHRHPVDEIVILHSGRLEVTIDGVTSELAAGRTIVFIPKGAVHGFRNASEETVELYGIFPTTRIGLEYVERNPAPGTEGDPPQPLFEYDVRAVQKG